MNTSDERQEERRKIVVALDELLAKRLDRHLIEENIEKDRVRGWHVGKEIPLAIIIVIIIQTAGVIWWAASTSAKVDFLKESNTAAQIVQTAVDRRQDDDRRQVELRIMTLFEKMDRKLDTLIDIRLKKLDNGYKRQ